ncbi:hypothetical protein EDD36DRAFT_465557 [Exophiala viscosa]|uniref:Uncharacterized protein n=1 Tax=Exophiala viscosa TaxID=2486360 RepID=A0AAN6IDG0_9EURO|nr:hypothetical protein EDD36DRAFT_465557 [Exophiala viscosa]
MPESIDLTETELFSLYARYPEIQFESNQEVLNEKEQFSSPSSNNTDHNDTQFSTVSVSTAHTTPPKTNISSNHDSHSPFEDFLENIQKSDMPENSKAGFELIGTEIIELGSLLSAYGNSENSCGPNSCMILCQSCPLLVRLQHCNYRVEEQISNMSFIKTLAPFRIVPSQQDLWCNYRQMAQLIAKYTALPSRTEQRLLDELTYVFDACVYQQLVAQDIDNSLQDRINELYDVLMSLLSKYTLWWNGMEDLTKGYMLPTLRAMRQAPDVLRQVTYMEQSISAARAAFGKSQASGMQNSENQVVEALNLTVYHTQMAIPPKSKRRYRREHTL